MTPCLLFNIYLRYEDEEKMRPIATGCTKEQLLDVLSRHACLAQVDHFLVRPMTIYEPFKEYTL